MGTEELCEPSYSIAKFCKNEGFSEPTYYKLKAMGLGPTEMRLPGINVVRITHEARIAWQQMMQNPTDEQAEAARAVIERLRAKGRMAARRAVESPRHVSKPTGTPKRRRQQQGEAAR
jgi:hypothetical protein